jgi:hypothetical protein
MTLSRHIRSVVLLFAAGFVSLGAVAETPPAPHPLTIDDMIAMERIGHVEIAAGGHLVLFEKGGPKEGFSDYGLDDPVASSRIYVFDRSKPAAPKRLFRDFAFPNWIGSISPNGEKLAIFWLEHALVKAGVVDLATNKLTKFPFNPTFDFQQSTPLWISDDALIYSADPKDHPSPRIDFRRQAASMENAADQRAWHGQTSVTVIESHATDFTPDWRPGTIVKVAADTGRTTVLADGKYVELSLSPDHHYLAAGRQGYYLRFRPDSGKEVYDPHRLEPRLFDLANPQTGAVPMCEGCQLSGLSDFTWGAERTSREFLRAFRHGFLGTFALPDIRCGYESADGGPPYRARSGVPARDGTAECAGGGDPLCGWRFGARPQTGRSQSRSYFHLQRTHA